MIQAIQVDMRPNPAQDGKVIKLSERRLTDAELVQGLVARDLHAAHALYERYGDRINRLVWKMLGADAEHDDVVQQVFVNLMSSIKSLREPSALGAWLNGVAANTVRRELRNRKYRRWLHPSMELSADDHCAQGGAKEVVVQRVYELLRELRPAHQVVLTLRYMEGLTLGELAEACGCSLATVKRRLLKARKRFMLKARRDAVVAAWLQEACLGE